jgi:hypothetical protein
VLFYEYLKVLDGYHKKKKRDFFIKSTKICQFLLYALPHPSGITLQISFSVMVTTTHSQKAAGAT